MTKVIQWMKNQCDKNRPRYLQLPEDKVPLLLKPRSDSEDPSKMDTNNSIPERLPMEPLLTVTDYLDDTSSGSCKTKQLMIEYAGEGFKTATSFWKLLRGPDAPVIDRFHWPNFPVTRLRALPDPPMTWIRDSLSRRWTWRVALYCQHCEAEIDVVDTRSHGCNLCDCDICPRIPDVHFTRYGSARSGRGVPRVDMFTYDRMGRVQIVEFGLWPQKFRPVLQLPDPMLLQQLLRNAYTHKSPQSDKWRSFFTSMAEIVYSRDSDSLHSCDCSGLTSSLTLDDFPGFLD